MNRNGKGPWRHGASEQCSGQGGEQTATGAPNVRAGKRAEQRGPGFLREVEPWPEPVEGRELLDELAATLKRFVILPEWAEDALALWVLHTHGFELRDVSPCVRVESPHKHCGKTTLLEVLHELVARPVFAANIIPPALFPVIEEIRPTLLIDQAAFLYEDDDLPEAMNAGCSRQSAFVVRVANPVRARQDGGGRGSGLARVSCWCPKVWTAIGWLPEKLTDQCIVVRMLPKGPREQTERFWNLHGTALPRKCARFVKDHRDEISSARPKIPVGLTRQASDIWEPLLALADIAGGNWPERARRAALHLSGGAQQNIPLGPLLVDAFLVFTVFGAERLSSRKLVAVLNSLSDRPWQVQRRGRGITALWLANRLRPCGIWPLPLRIDGIVNRGYLKQDFLKALGRYVPKSKLELLKQEETSKSERKS